MLENSPTKLFGHFTKRILGHKTAQAITRIGRLTNGGQKALNGTVLANLPKKLVTQSS